MKIALTFFQVKKRFEIIYIYVYIPGKKSTFIHIYCPIHEKKYVNTYYHNAFFFCLGSVYSSTFR